MRIRTAFMAFCAGLLTTTGASALSAPEVNVTPGLIMIFTSDAASPSPIALSVGASLPVMLDGLFMIEPSIDLFGVNYRYGDTRALPASIESLDGFFTACMLIGAQAGVRYPLTKELALGGTAGVDVLIRFPLELFNGSAESIADRDPAFSYFYGALRFLYPETRIFLRWQVVKEMGLVFSVRAFYPLFHIWDGEGLPFYDQLMLAGSLGFTIKL